MADAKGSSLTAAQLDLVRQYVSEIASACHVLRELGIEAVSAAKDDPAGVVGVSVREIASKAGFLADQCSQMLGDAPVAGEWHEWLLPPSAREALERVRR